MPPSQPSNPLEPSLEGLRRLLECSENPAGHRPARFRGPGNSTAQWQWGRIPHVPALRAAAAARGLCAPSELTVAAIRAIADILCMNRSIDPQQAYRLSLSEVVGFLRERGKQLSGHWV